MEKEKSNSNTSNSLQNNISNSLRASDSDYKINQRIFSGELDSIEEDFSKIKLMNSEKEKIVFTQPKQRLPIFQALDSDSQKDSNKESGSNLDKASTQRLRTSKNEISSIKKNSDEAINQNLRNQNLSYAQNMHSVNQANHPIPQMSFQAYQYPMNQYMNYSMSSNLFNQMPFYPNYPYYPQNIHFHSNNMYQFQDINNQMNPQNINKFPKVRASKKMTKVEIILNKLKSLVFYKSASEVNQIKNLISELEEEKDFNSLLNDFASEINILVSNPNGNKIFNYLLSLTKFHQRLTIWRSIIAYATNYNSHTYDCYSKLLDYKENKQEETFIINLMKPKFSLFAYDTNGSVVLQRILNFFSDDAKYILISFIHEEIQKLSENPYGTELIICLIDQMSSKPSKIKESFIESIKPHLFTMATSKDGHLVIVSIIKKWNFMIWKDLKEIILKNSYLLYISKYFFAILQIICERIVEIVSFYS